MFIKQALRKEKVLLQKEFVRSYEVPNYAAVSDCDLLTCLLVVGGEETVPKGKDADDDDNDVDDGERNRCQVLARLCSLPTSGETILFPGTWLFVADYFCRSCRR